MQNHVLSILVLTFSMSCNGDITNCDMSSSQIHHNLKYDLLCDYDYNIRPRMNHKNATKIIIRMVVNSFTYDMHTNTITINNWLPITWVDDHLKWDPSDYDNVDFIDLGSDEIWTPDLAIYNKHHQGGIHKVVSGDLDCLVRYTGKVTCVPPNEHEATCVADLRKYPYDKQTCTLQFGSWVNSGEQMDFFFGKNPIARNNIQNSEWKIVNAFVKKFVDKESCCPNETYPSVGFSFTIERRPSFHEASIVVPALVIVIFTLLTLYLNVMERERFYLIIANILLHIIFIQHLTWKLPRIGHKTPYIVTFAKYSFLICMIEFIITLILRRMVKATSSNTGWTSTAIGFLINSRVGQVLLIFDKSYKISAAADVNNEDAINVEKKQSIDNVDNVIFAKLLDRLLFIIFVIIYISMYIRLIA